VTIAAALTDPSLAARSSPVVRRSADSPAVNGTPARGGARLLTAVAVAVVWLGALAFIEFDRRTTLVVARDTGENLARIFAEQAARSFDGFDRVLRNLANALATDPWADLRTIARASDLLSDGLVVLTYADADGTVRARLGGGPIGGLSLRERAHFQALAGGETGLYVDRPYLTRSDHRWVIVAGRRVERQGRFAGVVVASIDPRYFQRFFETLNAGQDGIVLLGRDDGVILAGTAMTDAMYEAKIGAPDIARLARERSAGVVERASEVDQMHRLVAYRHVERAPLFVSVGQARGEVLAPVIRRASALLLGAAAATAALLLLRNRALRAGEREAASADAARHAEGRLRLAIDALSDGFMLFDAEGRFELCNACYHALLGSAADKIRPGLPFDDYLRAVYDAGILDLRGMSFDQWREQRRLAPGETGRIYEQRLTDGRWLLCVDRRSADGSTVGLRTDITPLKRREEELESARLALTRRTYELRHAKRDAELANAARGAFLANMSHELRTPLNAIIGFADLIPMFAGHDKRLADYAGHIHESGLHLLSLIDDLLDLSKIDAGKLVLHPAEILPAALAETCRTMMAELAQRAHVRLSFEVAPDCPAIFADLRAAKQMALNLLSNAIKFTPAGGAVAVEISAGAGGGVELTVCDDGVGMTQEELVLARAPFGQGRAAHLVTQRGTGLGLALVERLIEAHGGALELDSTPGEGTCARLWFPPAVEDVRVA
jgi:signal transduction histidine kinase